MSNQSRKGHKCSDACGITRDPGCPRWKEPEFPRGSPDWLNRCSSVQRREYDVGLGLAHLLRSNADILVPALLDLLREEFIEMIRETVVQDLGPLLAKRKRRRK